MALKINLLRVSKETQDSVLEKITIRWVTIYSVQDVQKKLRSLLVLNAQFTTFCQS
eukprot:SAG11_NODE_10425_length_832_cov_2.680764_1_plen_55_part_10